MGVRKIHFSRDIDYFKKLYLNTVSESENIQCHAVINYYTGIARKICSYFKQKIYSLLELKYRGYMPFFVNLKKKIPFENFMVYGAPGALSEFKIETRFVLLTPPDIFLYEILNK
jgi:hypothetical protein